MIVSVGTPAALSVVKRSRMPSRRSLTVLSVVSMTCAAASRSGLSNSRSLAMPSAAGRSSASGWRRRVSEKRRSSRSEEHTSELQSLMRISYAVFCLKKKTKKNRKQHYDEQLQTKNAHKHKKREIQT